LLSAVTGQRDIVVGAAAANRLRGELQSMTGFLVNHVLMRFRFDPECTFRQWISCVRKVVLETAAYADLPYAMLRRELLRKGVMMPATDTIFSVSRHGAVKEFAGLTVTNLNLEHHITNYHIDMHFDEHNESHNCLTRFDAGWYDRERVQAFVQTFKRLLDAASRHPDSSMNELFAMSAIEQRQPPSLFRMAYVIGRRLQQRWRRRRQFAS
jgi:non-ribosomal peptide synthetase component F